MEEEIKVIGLYYKNNKEFWTNSFKDLIPENLKSNQDLPLVIQEKVHEFLNDDLGITATLEDWKLQRIENGWTGKLLWTLESLVD